METFSFLNKIGVELYSLDPETGNLTAELYNKSFGQVVSLFRFSNFKYCLVTTHSHEQNLKQMQGLVDQLVNSVIQKIGQNPVQSSGDSCQRPDNYDNSANPHPTIDGEKVIAEIFEDKSVNEDKEEKEDKRGSEEKASQSLNNLIRKLTLKKQQQVKDSLKADEEDMAILTNPKKESNFSLLSRNSEKSDNLSKKDNPFSQIESNVATLSNFHNALNDSISVTKIEPLEQCKERLNLSKSHLTEQSSRGSVQVIRGDTSKRSDTSEPFLKESGLIFNSNIRRKKQNSSLVYSSRQNILINKNPKASSGSEVETEYVPYFVLNALEENRNKELNDQFGESTGLDLDQKANFFGDHSHGSSFGSESFSSGSDNEAEKKLLEEAALHIQNYHKNVDHIKAQFKNNFILNFDAKDSSEDKSRSFSSSKLTLGSKGKILSIKGSSKYSKGSVGLSSKNQIQKLLAEKKNIKHPESSEDILEGHRKTSEYEFSSVSQSLRQIEQNYNHLIQNALNISISNKDYSRLSSVKEDNLAREIKCDDSNNSKNGDISNISNNSQKSKGKNFHYDK